jgi:hypothetical protein
MNIPIANARNHTSCYVLAKCERRALDKLSNNLNRQPSNDAPFATEQVAKEEGEHCTD